MVLAVAALIRFSFVFNFPQKVSKDAADYDRIAWNIVTTSQMYPNAAADSIEVLGRTPVYPVFLAIIYKLGWHSYVLVRMVQAIFDLGMCLLIFLIARNIGFGVGPSILAFILVAINPFASAYVGALISESLGTFLFVLSFYLFYLAIKKNSLIMFLFTGLLFGILTLCRPQFVIVLPLIFAISSLFWLKSYQTNFVLYSILVFIIVAIPYLSLLGILPDLLSILSAPVFLATSLIMLIFWFVIPKNMIKQDFVFDKSCFNSNNIIGILAAVIFSILSILPWTYRNYFISGKFVPLVSSLYPPGGAGYLITLPIPFGKDPMEVDERWNRFIRSSGEEQDKLRKEMDEIGLHRLKTKPHYYLWLTFRRTLRLWNHGNLLYSQILPRWIWGIFTGIAFVYYLLAALGVWVTRRQWRILFPLYIPFFYLTMLCAPGHVEARYSIEAFPIVCLFGGTGLFYLWSRYKKKDISEGEMYY